MKTVLIVGAGIAGLTAAYWLNHYGFSVDVIEKSECPKKEGYLIDFWGAGFNVCEKMGILPLLSKKDFPLKHFIFIDAGGEIESSFSISELRILQKQRVFTIFRGELEKILYDSVSLLPVRTYTTIIRMENSTDGVMAYFNDETSKKYDLVIGADGAHSKTRECIFGDEKQFSHYLGYQVAACIQPCSAVLERSLYTYSNIGKQATVCFLENKRAATFYVYAEAAEKINNPEEKLIQAFRGSGWIMPELIDQLKNVDTVFFDALSQINLPVWHKNRVVLIGDASHCLTLAAGQGASMAMAGAYILATLLHKNADHYQEAFLQYQNIMQPGMQHKQRESQKFLAGFIPQSDLVKQRRNFYTRYFFKAMFEKTAIEDFCD
ncbi:MAG: FAD-dependent monooxygenase [Coxiellaceae bacterium]|nr:FAD-dependent monooxygenase [Coxiellaceae bacterium]